MKTQNSKRKIQNAKLKATTQMSKLDMGDKSDDIGERAYRRSFYLKQKNIEHLAESI